MEPTETSITPFAALQVGKPSLFERLFFSAWYLEASAIAGRFAAHNAFVIRKLNEVVLRQCERDGGAR